MTRSQLSKELEKRVMTVDDLEIRPMDVCWGKSVLLALHEYLCGSGMPSIRSGSIIGPRDGNLKEADHWQTIRPGKPPLQATRKAAPLSRQPSLWTVSMCKLQLHPTQGVGLEDASARQVSHRPSSSR